MITKRVINELKKKENNELQKYQYLGAEIKNSRLKLSKTLESMINVSKSVSYISKVENNKIIPNQECLEELCDELLINKSSLNTLGNFDISLDKAIEAIFFNDEEKIETLYNEYKEFSNLRTDLMKGLYFFYHDDKKMLKEIVNNLSKVESSLILSDYFIYILLCIKNLINNKEVLSAFQILKIVLESNKTNKYLHLLYCEKEYELRLSFSISSCNEECKKIMNDYIENMNFKQTEKFDKMNLRNKIELSDDEYLESIIEDIQYIDLKAYAYCKLGMLEKVDVELFNSSDKLLYYFKSKDLNNIENLILSVQLTEEELIKANLYKLTLEDNTDELREFITNVAIPYYLNVCKVTTLLELFEQLGNINSKISKYKETTLVAKKIMSLISDILKITI